MKKRVYIALVSFVLIVSLTIPITALGETGMRDENTEEATVESSTEEPSGESETEPDKVESIPQESFSETESPSEKTSATETSTEKRTSSDQPSSELQTPAESSSTEKQTSKEQPTSEKATTMPPVSEEPSGAEQTSLEVPTQPASEEVPTSNYEEGDVDPGLGLEFRIIDNYRFSDMKSTYAKGYIPTVSNGTVNIVFPLEPIGTVNNNKITVTPDLGGTADSPFVYKNYQQTVKMTKERPVGNGTKKTFSVFLVCVKLQLSSKRYNGVYPVMINVEATSGTGNKVVQTFTSFVTITDGRSTEPTEPYIPPETKPQPAPVLYVESFTVTPEPAVAGQDFTVVANIRNRGSSKNVKNVQVRVSAETDQLTLMDDSDLFFIDVMEKGSALPLSIHYHADPGISAGKCHITLSISGEDGDGGAIDATGNIEFTVTQPMRIEASFPSMPESVNAGDTVSLAFQAVNMGKSDAYNVRFEMDIPGLIANGSAYIGTLSQANSSEQSMNVFIGQKSMNSTLADGADEYGYTEGTIALIYEDETGKEYREEKYYHTTINKLVIEPTTAPEQPREDPTSTQWWIFVAFGAGVIAVLASIGVLQKRKKKTE